MERFGLEDPEFWSDPFRTEDEVLLAHLRETEGVVLAGPRTLDPRKRETLPLLACRVAPFQRMVQTPFYLYGLLTAVDLQTNRLHVGLAEPEDDHVVANPPDPNTPPPKGRSARLIPLAARKALRLPWKPGRWVFRVVWRDLISNAVPIEFSGDPPEPHGQAQPSVGPPLLQDASPLEPPDTPGLSLAAQRVVVLDAEASLPLRCAFRLVPAPHERAQDPTPDGPQAVVGISFLLTSSLGALGACLPVHVACRGSADEAGCVTGAVTVDLLAWGGLDRVDQTLFVYAFSGEAVAGPTLAALVSPQRLPQES